MWLFKALTIWFWLLNPEPHHSFLSHISSLSLPSSSLGLYANGKREIELNIGAKISFGRWGEAPAIGGGTINFYTKFKLPSRYFGEAYLATYSDKEPYGFIFWGLGTGRFFKWKTRDFIWEFSFSYLYYYELSDKYTFTNLNAEVIAPFHWGRYFQPFLGLQAEWARYGFPENIRSGSLRGFYFKIGAGINFQYRWLNAAFSTIGNRGNLSFALSLGFVK